MRQSLRTQLYEEQRALLDGQLQMQIQQMMDAATAGEKPKYENSANSNRSGFG